MFQKQNKQVVGGWMNGDRRFGYSVTGGSLFTGHPFGPLQSFSLIGSQLPTSQGPRAGLHNGMWTGEFNPGPVLYYSKELISKLYMGIYLQSCHFMGFHCLQLCYQKGKSYINQFYPYLQFRYIVHYIR